MAALSASVAAWPASAASFVDLAAIDREVETFTGSPIGEPGGAAMPVDRRLRLNLCGAAFALRWAGPRRDSVVVSCPEPGGWRVFVPIAGGGQGEAGAPAVIRGDAVTIAVTGANFAVMQPGEALEAGAVGAWIQVRPAQSQAQTKPAALRARVVRPGLVSLTLP
jgi:flagella basal body P-ring formation protein FlgA